MIVALLTDFGTHDHYVGAMKGVILSVCPGATLVDITHEIAPQDVTAAAIQLSAAYRYFPPGTVFLVVVDPGVGSARRAIAADAGGYRFVGPDNGVLSLALHDAGGQTRVVELTERKYARPTISATFEGRDRFAPAAGWLARGVDVAALGRAVLDPRLLDLPTPTVTAAGIDGRVMHIDRFGNLITNITAASITQPVAYVDVAGRRIEEVVATYSDVPASAMCALIGSSGFLEIAVNGGSAAGLLGVERTSACSVQVRFRR